MTRIWESIAMAEQSTFGRDGAMFEGLLGFVAQLSIALWSLVILTTVIRFVGMRIYRRAAARKAPVEPLAVRRTEPLPTARARGAHAAHAAHAPSAHAAPATAVTADAVEV